MSDLLILITTNTDKHKFISIWIWIRCTNDAMIDLDCVMKCDIYILKISEVYHFMLWYIQKC